MGQQHSKSHSQRYVEGRHKGSAQAERTYRKKVDVEGIEPRYDAENDPNLALHRQFANQLNATEEISLLAPAQEWFEGTSLKSSLNVIRKSSLNVRRSMSSSLSILGSKSHSNSTPKKRSSIGRQFGGRQTGDDSLYDSKDGHDQSGSDSAIGKATKKSSWNPIKDFLKRTENKWKEKAMDHGRGCCGSGKESDDKGTEARKEEGKSVEEEVKSADGVQCGVDNLDLLMSKILLQSVQCTQQDSEIFEGENSNQDAIETLKLCDYAIAILEEGWNTILDELSKEREVQIDRLAKVQKDRIPSKDSGFSNKSSMDETLSSDGTIPSASDGSAPPLVSTKKIRRMFSTMDQCRKTLELYDNDSSQGRNLKNFEVMRDILSRYDECEQHLVMWRMLRSAVVFKDRIAIQMFFRDVIQDSRVFAEHSLQEGRQGENEMSKEEIEGPNSQGIGDLEVDRTLSKNSLISTTAQHSRAEGDVKKEPSCTEAENTTSTLTIEEKPIEVENTFSIAGDEGVKQITSMVQVPSVELVPPDQIEEQKLNVVETNIAEHAAIPTGQVSLTESHVARQLPQGVVSVFQKYIDQLHLEERRNEQLHGFWFDLQDAKDNLDLFTFRTLVQDIKNDEWFRNRFDLSILHQIGDQILKARTRIEKEQARIEAERRKMEEERIKEENERKKREREEDADLCAELYKRQLLEQAKSERVMEKQQEEERVKREYLDANVASSSAVRPGKKRKKRPTEFEAADSRKPDTNKETNNKADGIIADRDNLESKNGDSTTVPNGNAENTPVHSVPSSMYSSRNLGKEYLRGNLNSRREITPETQTPHLTRSPRVTPRDFAKDCWNSNSGPQNSKSGTYSSREHTEQSYWNQVFGSYSKDFSQEYSSSKDQDSPNQGSPRSHIDLKAKPPTLRSMRESQNKFEFVSDNSNLKPSRTFQNVGPQSESQGGSFTRNQTKDGQKIGQDSRKGSQEKGRYDEERKRSNQKERKSESRNPDRSKRSSEEKREQKHEACSVLGINLKEGGDTETVKKAFKKRALEWHPDRAHNHDRKEEATLMFQRINQAMTLLLGTQKE